MQPPLLGRQGQKKRAKKEKNNLAGIGAGHLAGGQDVENGKQEEGTKAVTVRSTASLIHHTAIRAATAAVLQAARLIPSGGGSSSSTTHSPIPPSRPSRWRIGLEDSASGIISFSHSPVSKGSLAALPRLEVVYGSLDIIVQKLPNVFA